MITRRSCLCLVWIQDFTDRKKKKKNSLTITLDGSSSTFGLWTEAELMSYWIIYLISRYDKISESLALRILNIKNIPRNNKDVSRSED